MKRVRKGESSWTELIVMRIQKGMKVAGEQLTSEEEELLWSSVFDLPSGPSWQEKGKALNDKCIAALARAYDREIEVSKSDIAKKMGELGEKIERPEISWRRMLEKSVQANEDSVACGILQNWYASIGRNQEKKATGCLTSLVFVVGLGLIIAQFVYLLRA